MTVKEPAAMQDAVNNDIDDIQKSETRGRKGFDFMILFRRGLEGEAGAKRNALQERVDTLAAMRRGPQVTPLT